MAELRSRPRMSYTLDPDTIKLLDKLVVEGKAKSGGQAIDMLKNHYVLTMGNKDLDQMVEEASRRVLEANSDAWQVLVGDINETIKVEVQRVVTEHTKHEVAKAEEIAQEDDMRLKQDRIRAECRSVSEGGVRLWVDSHADEIVAAGLDAQAFLNEKLAGLPRKEGVEQAQIPVTEHVKAPKTEYVPVQSNELIDKLAWAMIEYWVEHEKPSSTNIQAKEFRVAQRWAQFEKFRDQQDNGEKEKLTKDMQDRLVVEAEKRKWNTELYLNDAFRLRRESPRMMREMTGQLKKDGGRW